MNDPSKMFSVEDVDEIRKMADDPEVAKLMSQQSSGGSAHKNYLKDAWGDMPDVDRSAERLAARRAATLSKKGLRSGAKKLAKRGLKAIPLIGPAIGALEALRSGDVSAAVPILNEIEGTGPAKGTLEHALEMGDMEAAAKLHALQELRKKGREFNQE